MSELTNEQLAQVEKIARLVAREEIAGLAGKALRRTQDRDYTRSPDRNLAVDVSNDEAAQLWGEILAEYQKEEWPVPRASAETSGIAADYAESAE